MVLGILRGTVRYRGESGILSFTEGVDTLGRKTDNKRKTQMVCYAEMDNWNIIELICGRQMLNPASPDILMFSISLDIKCILII